MKKVRLDPYSLRARVAPVVLMALPALVLLTVAASAGDEAGISCGAIALALSLVGAKLGRGRGRRLQPDFWAEWGGAPSIQRLRHRGQSEERVARLHACLGQVLGEPLPTRAEEERDREAADRRYGEAWVRLRDLTEDRSRFRPLFAKMVNYGQRRNLLGLRPFGITLSLLTVATDGVLLWIGSGGFGDRAGNYGPGLAAGAVLFVFWAGVVRRGWVRTAAEAYADQLMVAIDVLASGA